MLRDLDLNLASGQGHINNSTYTVRVLLAACPTVLQ